MSATYESAGVRFDYPEDWTLEEDKSEGGHSVTLQSPQTAFLFLSFHPRTTRIEDVLEATLIALREDYPDLESEEVNEKIAGVRARGLDIEFFSMDLTNTCRVRSFQTDDNTVLLMCQSTDSELEYAGPVFDAMRQSFELIDA
jgi:hypothetical protein